MVIDAFHNTAETPLEKMPFLEYLPKQYCYIFILRHPLNHIVIPISSPKMYLVSVYHIDSVNHISTFVSPKEYLEWGIFKNMQDGIIHFPKTYEFDSSSETNMYSGIIEKYASVHTSFQQMGVLFLNVKTGERSSVLNPNYTEMTQLRGNYSDIQYQYLCLRRIGKVLDFIKYFPQYRTLFFQFRDEYEQFITNIHQSYISYYVLKDGKQISPKFFSLVYKIHHELFIPSISSESRVIIRRNVVREYLETLNPGTLLHYMKYNTREYRLEQERRKEELNSSDK
jgi:hypothetical protein